MNNDKLILLRGVSVRLVSPLHQINLETEIYTGPA